MKFSIQHRLSGSAHIQFDGEFAEGERIAVIGISGAGKSTLLRYLAGLEHRGQVDIRTQAGLVNNAWQSDVVYVHQTPVMFAHHRVEQTIAFAQKLSGRDDLPLMRWADMLDLESLLQQPCQQLSGGQQQRVSMLRALASGSQWLLLDESFSALDTQRLIAACDVVGEYTKLTGAGLLLASHNDYPQRYLCNSAYQVENLKGRYQQDLFAALQQSEQARLTTLTVTVERPVHNLLMVFCEGQAIFLNPPTHWVEGTARISIPASEIGIAISDQHETSLVNRIQGRIVDMVSQGAYRTLVTLDIGGQPLAVSISNWSAERLQLKTNQDVFAEFKVGTVLWHGQI